MEQNTLINIKDVNLRFGDTIVLTDINIKIDALPPMIPPRSRIVALCAVSGKGKSQLLRIIAGLTPLKNETKKLSSWQKIIGTIIGHDEDVTEATGQILIGKDQSEVKEGDMGVIFQEYYMPQWLRIKKMLYKAAYKNPIYKKDDKEINKAIDQIAEDFDLAKHIDKFPSKLSGGQRQRANIAMQLLNCSDYILMDEPYSGLDVIMIDKVVAMIRKVSITDPHKTFIIVSHDLENCLAIADSVYILSDKGRTPGTGASIIANIDMISRGLAWREDVKRLTAFHNTIDEIKSLLV